MANEREVKKRAPEPGDSGAMLVEVARIELASEDLQRTGSTCLSDRFGFAAAHAHRLA